MILESFSFVSGNGDRGKDFASADESEDGDPANATQSSSPGNSSVKNIFYRCDKCSYQTKIRSLLERHEAKHKLDWRFQCSLCDFSDFDHSAFVDHWVTHQYTQVMKCTFCSFKCISSESLKTHIPTHRPVQMLDCTLCEYSSNSVKSMTSHVEKSHMSRNDNDKYVKPSVGNFSKSGCGNAGHYNCSCSPDSPEEPEVVELPVGKYEESVFKCSLCDFETANMLSLRYHTVVFHKKKVGCDYCPAVMTKHDMIQHAMKEHHVDFGTLPSFVERETVSTCDESKSPNVVELVSSLVLKKTAQELKCSFCDYSTKKLVFLKSHLSRLHKHEYSCGHCSAVLTKHALIEHCQNIHGVTYGKTTSKFCRSYTKEVDGDVGSYTLGKFEGVCSSELQSLNAETGQSKESALAEASSSEYLPAEESGVSSARDQGSSSIQIKRFKCPSCQFLSRSRMGLKKHHHCYHKKKYSCKHCKAVMTKYRLLLHSKKEHGVNLNNGGKASISDTRAHRLPRITKYADSRQTGDLHSSNVASLKTFVCSICQYSSLIKRSYQRHVEYFHSQKFPCRRCSASELTKFELMKHSKKVHGVIIKRIGKRTPGLTMHNEGPIDANEPGSDRVSRADHNERSPSAGIHMNSGNLVENSKFKNPGSSSKILLPSKILKKETNPDSKHLQCYNCSFKTKIRFQMSRHVKLHLPESELNCPKCGFREESLASFARHFKYHSKSEDTLDCCFCSFSSYNFKSFMEHLNRHRAIDRYYCSKCKYSCRSSSVLSMHFQKLHVMKYVCQECPKSGTKMQISHHMKKCHPFSALKPQRLESKEKIKKHIENKVNLSSSKMMHRNRMKSNASTKASYRRIRYSSGETEGEELFQCSTCEYQTTRKDLLQRHEPKHLPLKCPTCELEFNRGHLFASHLTEHNPPESPYKCWYCGHIAKRIGNLHVHLSKHLEALKIYDCPKCIYSQFRRDYLNLHIKTHHKTGAGKSGLLRTDSPNSSGSKVLNSEMSPT